MKPAPNTDKQIDEIIKEMYLQHPNLFSINAFLLDREWRNLNVQISSENRDRIIEIMAEKGLIKIHKASNNEARQELTPFGKEIYENGGWITNKKRQKTDRILSMMAVYGYPIIAFAISLYAIKVGMTSKETENKVQELESRMERFEQVQNPHTETKIDSTMTKLPSKTSK